MRILGRDSTTRAPARPRTLRKGRKMAMGLPIYGAQEHQNDRITPPAPQTPRSPVRRGGPAGPRGSRKTKFPISFPISHSLQTSRYELKYLIDEQCARSVRDYARCHLVPDRYAADLPNCEYDVHSLYLDSPDLALCRATRHGERNRFKLRIRFYDDRPDSPAYFEIKRRTDSVIHKRRSAVRRTAVERLLAGQQPRPRTSGRRPARPSSARCWISSASAIASGRRRRCTFLTGARPMSLPTTVPSA